MWPKRSFEQCLEKVKNTTKIPKKKFLVDGEFPIVSQEKDHINGYWDNASDVFEVTKPLIVFGDHTQTIKYIDFDFVIGADGVKIIKPTGDIDTKFFYYFIMAHPIKSLGYARHYRLLKELSIPVPPLEEQKRIVGILDEAFAGIDQAIANTEKNLQNARDLFESYLNNIFTQKGDGWEETTLGQVCGFENGDRGKNYPSRTKFVSEGICFINAGHIENGSIDFNGMNYITQETFDLLSRGKVKRNDILFCLRGSLGKFALVNEEIDGAIASSLVILRPYENLLASFFLHYLRSGHCKNMIEKFSGGAAQPNLGAKDLAKFTISVPHKDEQEALASTMDAMMGQTKILEDTYQQKLTALKELKQSLLQKAFAGELTADMQEAA